MIASTPSLADGTAALKTRLMREAPHLTDHIEGISAFAMKMGGEGSVHIKWVGELHERFVGGTRRIRGQFFHELAQSVPVALPRVKRATLFMQYSCPKEFVKDRFCEWLSPTEVRNTAKSPEWQKKATECESRMEGLEAEFAPGNTYQDIRHKDFQMVFARLESRVAQMLFGKKFGGQQPYNNMDDIVAAMADEVQQLRGVPASSSVAPAKRAKIEAVLMDPAGRVIDQAALLKEKGLQVGVYVKCVAPVTQAVQQEVSEGGQEVPKGNTGVQAGAPSRGAPKYRVVHECSVSEVVLLDPSTRATESVSFKTFAQDWVVVMDAAEIQDTGVVLTWPGLSGSKTEEHLEMLAKAAVVHGLHTLDKAVMQKTLPDLRILTKPKLKVVAAADIPEHGLALCPFTHKVLISGNTSAAKVPPGSIRVPALEVLKDKVVHLAPQFTLPKADKPGSGFVEPFWAVRRIPAGSLESGLANCHLETVPISSAHVAAESQWIKRRPMKMSLELPVLVNSRAISEGEELLWIDSSIEEKKRPAAPVVYRLALRRGST